MMPIYRKYARGKKTRITSSSRAQSARRRWTEDANLEAGLSGLSCLSRFAFWGRERLFKPALILCVPPPGLLIPTDPAVGA